MSSKVHPGDFRDCGNGFWNARGSYKIGGLVEVGTQASLVALPSGNFLWLDSITLTGEALDKAMALTDGGRAVEAVLNLHPFHTLHCEWACQQFPNAKLYGSARHKAKLPGLNWEAPNVEDAAVAERFAHVLRFSLPRGVDYISADEKVHFSSLLAFHPASGTIHSDDTLSYMKLPFPLSFLRAETAVFFHPTLAKALEPRTGAAADFRSWARGLGRDWAGASRLCAAHNGIRDFPKRDFDARLAKALAKVEPVLAAHEAKVSA